MRPLDGRVVSGFIVQALTGQPLTVFGTGGQTRSFCYVSDLVDGLLGLIECPYTGPVNLGNPAEFTVSELAKLVIEMCQASAGVSYLPLPEDDPARRQPDIDLANRLFGFAPRVSLAEGLAITIDHFRQIIAR
jgi:UDP-glucuronate decarboxylase